MYLFSQEQELPCGPGIEWTVKGNSFHKSVMISQVSFPQIQWLMFMQESDICIDSNGNKIQIQHEYFRDEVVINGHKPDGYILRDKKNIFFEFLGEFNARHSSYITYDMNPVICLICLILVLRYSNIGYRIRPYIIDVICLGCKFHPGCCIADEQIENAVLKRHVWDNKKKWMESVGELHIMRECTWQKKLSNTPETFFPKTQIPRILLSDTKGVFS